ncbi:hypothetical protein CTAM01_16698 [Colletotrichum tamarilloi]|uniref:N-acetyltransferase domain-containing protein n=1 Tax=Colletotrichum tamarilloi TaxID=1209934 RepID=A0ABQ9QHU5_9PEZI|nr:uncharacterized protein CTAM01_16698 [Colletotrichum tamarilloi]KAK1470942.1 hypothetical protein CTAM01_16698 [Colletotrichum tamarilloi]
MLTDDLKGAYRSERLIFRAVENNDEDKKFLHTQIENDPVTVALSNPMALMPRTSKHSEWMVEQMAKSVLSVMVCLPADTSGDGDEEDDEAKTTAPKPIGYLAIGWGGIPPAMAHHRSIGLGIAIAPQYQGKGYGTEVINWALDWAFRYGNYHRVHLGTVSYNERAQHLYKRLGFVEEGRSRESYWFNRQWHDMISYGILESEWEAMRGINSG